MKRKKSQAWGIDLAIAMTIFSIGLIVFYIYSFNLPEEAETNIDAILYDGNIIADSVLSEGYPSNWTQDNVVKLGIISNNRINETKLNNFYLMANESYATTKSLFNTKYDYYFFLDRNMVLLGNVRVEGIGKPGTNTTNINAKNLAKITRFTIYEEKPTTAYFYIWEE